MLRWVLVFSTFAALILSTLYSPMKLTRVINCYQKDFPEAYIKWGLEAEKIFSVWGFYILGLAITLFSLIILALKRNDK